jgi:hypothetical protein
MVEVRLDLNAVLPRRQDYLAPGIFGLIYFGHQSFPQL